MHNVLNVLKILELPISVVRLDYVIDEELLRERQSSLVLDLALYNLAINVLPDAYVLALLFHLDIELKQFPLVSNATAECNVKLFYDYVNNLLLLIDVQINTT